MPEIEIQIPKKMVRPLFEPHRYKIFFGGRGSAKSWGVARALLAHGKAARRRIFCGREIQKSIADSSYKLLVDQIEMLGLGKHFDVLKTEIRGDNGSEILFRGLSSLTAESIKSMEGVDIVWLEEAHTISERSWELLIPTIRKPGSEIWATFNPDQDTDPVYTRFLKNTPPDCILTEMGWRDNPWFPDVLKREKDYLYQIDPEAAAHVWGGQCRRVTDAQVLRGRYAVESFEPRADLWDGPYQGVDWGFAVDPSVMCRVWLHERKLYVEHEAYGLGVDIDRLPALFDSIPDARKYVSRADNARPETISYMVRNGWNMGPARKWSGSVEDGVEFLRSFERIVIHPRCEHTAQEARLWSYKTDRLTGEVQPVLLDKHNHCWDAIRYALEPVIGGYLRSIPEREVEEENFNGGTGSWML